MFCRKCGAANDENNFKCTRCGEVLHPAAPGQIVRYGNLLIVPRGATLPSYCVKCGEPAAGNFIRESFWWHSPWLYFLVLAGLLTYVIVAMIVRKKMDLGIPVCNLHRARRRYLLLIGLAVLLLGIPACVGVGYVVGDPDGFAWGFLVWFVAFMAGLVLVQPLRALLRITYIDEMIGRFKGADERFLARIPALGATATPN